MRTPDRNLSGKKTIAALGRTRFALMQITDILYDGRPDQSIYLAGLENLSGCAMQHVQHVFGAFIGKHRASTNDFILLKKYPVHAYRPSANTNNRLSA